MSGTASQGVGIGRRLHQFEHALSGWPDRALSCLLVGLALVLLLIAWRGSALEKAIVAGWVIFP